MAIQLIIGYLCVNLKRTYWEKLKTMNYIVTPAYSLKLIIFATNPRQSALGQLGTFFIKNMPTPMCKEPLRSAPKVAEDNRESLKSLANLLQKCCVSLENIGQSSSRDSMHVIMSVVNKLPIELNVRGSNTQSTLKENSANGPNLPNCQHFFPRRADRRIQYLGVKYFQPKQSRHARRTHTYRQQRKPKKA